LFLFMCPFPVNGGLSIAKFCPPAALSRSMAGEQNLAVGNPATGTEAFNSLFENRLPSVFDN